VLVVLWPLFHYSDWRDAWVLRFVGERIGPVLAPLPYVPFRTRASVALGRTSEATRERLGEPVPRTRSSLAWLLGSCAIAAAVLGFVLSRTTGGSGPHHPPPLSAQVSAGALQLSFPGAWKHGSSPVAAQLGLSDVIDMSPSASGPQTLIVGSTATPNPQLLPTKLLSSLASPPTPQTVTLGRTAVYRYPDLVPQGQSTPESVYAMPTTFGTVVGVCVAPASGFAASCERSLATLHVTSGSRLSPGPSQIYASGLDSAIKTLDTAQAKTGPQLAHAHATKAQVAAASTLGSAYTHAADALSHLSAGPAATSNTDVVSALKSIASAFGALGSAASHHDSSAYGAAEASVKRGMNALSTAYGQLKPFGYNVS
jgi:hypothetical protein